MSWTGWALLNGGYAGGLEALAQDADGRVDAFGLAPAAGGQAAFHNAQTAPNSGWGGWNGLGSPPQNDVLSHLEVARNADGRLEAFLRYGAMSVGAMWHAWQSAPNGAWGGWVALGVAQTAPNSGWAGWTSIGKPASDSLVAASTVGTNADGRLEVFAQGSQGVWHAWQTAPNSGWSAWNTLGLPSGSAAIAGLAVATNADGRQELFVTVAGGEVWHIWQTAPNSGWSAWSSLGGEPYSTVLVGRNQDGRLEVFVVGRTASTPPNPSGVWHRWQTSPGGAWN